MVETIQFSEAKHSGRGLLKQGFFAIFGSWFLNLAILTVALNSTAIGRIDAYDMGYVSVFTLLGAIGAVLTYGVIDRISDSLDRHFVIVAVIVLLLSFIPNILLLVYQPDFGGEITILNNLPLMFMHVTTATACIVSLTDYAWEG